MPTELKYDASKWVKRPVEPGEFSSVLSKKLEDRINQSAARIKDIEPDTLHTFAPLSSSSPTLSSSSASSSTESVGPPSSLVSVLPAKRTRSFDYDAFELDSRNISYILVQIKARSKLPSRYELPYLNPFGCMIEKDPEDKRPYAAILMDFERHGNSRREDLLQINNDFCPERSLEVEKFGKVVPTPPNVLKFAIVNSHLAVSEELGSRLDDLLSMDPYDLQNCEDQDTRDKRVTQFPNAFNGSTVIPPKANPLISLTSPTG